MQGIAIAILAAGSSSRMGVPKQLLKLDELTFLERSIDNAQKAESDKVMIVLGANNAEILEIAKIPSEVQVLINAEWQAGVSTSIHTAVQAASGKYGALLFMVCDQPFVAVDILNELIRANVGSAKTIVACRYGESVGVPALFDARHFDALMQLQGDRGAKSVIQRHIDTTTLIDFPQGSVDIDTIQDLELARRHV